MGRLMDPTNTDAVGNEIIDAMVEVAESRHHVVTSYAQQEDDCYHIEVWVEPEVVPPPCTLHAPRCPEFRRANYHAINRRMAELNRALDAAENNSRRIDMMMEEGLI